ncbi:MAG: AEC family transporter [Candidatus Aenigmarchaeota archaeon]|nr:AEC family transporter [Candidatus Aenigmarchaeota archaeon]
MILENTVPLVIIFLIGYFFKKIKILKSKDSKVFSKLLMYVVIPAVIIDSFSRATIDASLIYLPISGLLVVITLTILGFLFAHVLKLDKIKKGAFVTTFPTLEGGTLGYAFMLSVFGAEGLSRLILFDISNAFYLFTVVYFISGRFGGNNTKITDALMDLIKTPLIWAMVVGLFLNFIGFQNVVVSNIFDMIGRSLLFLVMLMLGLEFHPEIKYFKLPMLEIFLKTACGFGIGVLLSSFFGFTELERATVIIGASLPPSFITLIFAKENGLDTKYVANLISIALPIGMLFMFLILGYL